MSSTPKLVVSLLAGMAIGAIFGVADATRNSSGTYVLPTGNPVVTGTAISSTVHNATMSDIGTELTASLERNGKGCMLAGLQSYVGTVSLPGITFCADTDTGFYRLAANSVAASMGGGAVMSWDAGGPHFPVGIPTGVAVGNSTTNGIAVTAIGNGSGTGVSGTGGATNAAGVTGTGGATNGVGVIGQGTGSGAGVSGTGGATDGIGVVAVGVGAGAGGTFSSTTGFGVQATGNTTAAPLKIVPQSATPSSTNEGQLYYDSDTDQIYGYSNGAWGGVLWLRGSVTVDLASLADNACGDVAGAITVTGALTASSCLATLPTDGSGVTGLTVSCFVPSANAVTLRVCCNNAGGACDPTSKTYYVAVMNP